MEEKIVMDYGICNANTCTELAEHVAIQVRAGWQPHGFIFQSVQGQQIFFHQALVKYQNAVVVTFDPKIQFITPGGRSAASDNGNAKKIKRSKTLK